MNDRFKFRVWDKREKRYIEEPSPTPMLQTNGLLAYFTNHPEYMENYDIQFCTGLKDKNGKLIYEGDIVTDGYHNMEVYYNQRDCRFILKKVTKYIIKRFGKGSFEHCYLMDRTEDYKCKDHWYKVIGNIYTDAHLLQECE